MEPLGKKKFLVLLDQEEERHYGFDLLKNIHEIQAVGPELGILQSLI